MNHSYCLLWNAATQRYVPVPETASSRGKSRAALTLAPMALLLGALLAPHAGAQALPSGGKVISGQAGISQNGSQMTIDQTSPKAILHWQGFDIGAGAKVQFNQPGAHAVALNRVLGGKASRIDGQLKANGQVWLVNPNGMVFGQGSQVNVGGLVASTLDITNDDFHAGKQIFSRGVAQGGITNQGNITVAAGGTLALLAPTVNNEGTLSARLGNVVLAGGDRVTLQAGADGRLQVPVDPATVRTLIENKRMIMADGGQVVMTSGAADALSASVVSNTGTVQARTLQNKEGRILLLADMQQGETVHSGVLDASAPEGGNGGFVETSAAKVTLADGRKVTTHAAKGDTGTWLIDPNDYRIAAEGGDITGAQLSADLAATNVIIDTARQGSSGGEGDIYVTDSVSWSKNRLTLNAERNITIMGDMAVNGEGALHLNYGNTRGIANQSPVDGSFVYFYEPVVFQQAGANLLAINGHGYEVINSMDGLKALGAEGRLGGRYALGRSLDAANDVDFKPIGVTPENPFTGTFEGMSNTISNLRIHNPGQGATGLFGYATNATLRNLTLKQFNVTGSANYTGGLVGHNLADGGKASIEGIDFDGQVNGTHHVGGLVGTNKATNGGTASISNAPARGLVSGHGTVGGLAGSHESLLPGSQAIINNASSTSTVTGQGGHVGGLIGLTLASGDISTKANMSNVETSGEVSGGTKVGGLVGTNRASLDSSTTISMAWASAEVRGGDHTGGLVGWNTSFRGGMSHISSSSASGNVTGKSNVGGLVGSNEGDLSTIGGSRAKGTVSGDAKVGTLVGFNSARGLIMACKATGETKGKGSSGALVGQDLSNQPTAAPVSAMAAAPG